MKPPTRLLGCIPSRRDPRTLRLQQFHDLPDFPVPTERRWDAPVSTWGVQGNDRYGNCVICTAAHAIQAWGANESDLTAPISDTAVIEQSREMGALNGYSILDRLRWWNKRAMWGNQLWAYASFPIDNPQFVQAVINDFGVADIALSMPAAWQSEKIWATGAGRGYRPGSWGEHSVPLVGYDENCAYMITWGYVQAITYAALAAYSGEAYALLNPTWMASGDATTPSGFDLERLHAELREVTA